MKLTDTFVRKVKLKKGKNEDWYSDGVGTNFYLRVRSGNQKDWFYRGKLGDHTIKRGIGSYPTVSLEEARELITTCKKCVHKGIDPRDHFNAQKDENLKVSDDMYKFSTLLEDVIEYNTTMTDKTWSEPHIRRYRGLWKNYLEKHLKNKSILNTSHTEILAILKKIKSDPVALVSGKTDIKKYNRTTTMNFAKTLLNIIYNHAIDELNWNGENAIDRIRSNKIFKKMKKPVQHSSIVEEDFGRYWNGVKTLKNIEDRVALIVLTTTALRVGSLLNAKWSWYNKAKKTLSIPPEFMKRREAFVTPLPDFAVDALNELNIAKRASKDDYIFHDRSGGHMNLNRPRLLIKQVLGFDYATAHGTRTVLKTNLEKSGKFNSLAIEAQLHHDIKDKVERSYMADYDWLKERFDIVEFMVTFMESREKEYLSIMSIGDESQVEEVS
jgi:integrase